MLNFGCAGVVLGVDLAGGGVVGKSSSNSVFGVRAPLRGAGIGVGDLAASVKTNTGE